MCITALFWIDFQDKRCKYSHTFYNLGRNDCLNDKAVLVIRYTDVKMITFSSSVESKISDSSRFQRSITVAQFVMVMILLNRM